MPPRRSKRQRRRQQPPQPQRAAPIYILPADLWVAIAAALNVDDLAAYRATCQESLRAVNTHTTAALRKHYRAMVYSKLYLGSARVYSHYCATVRDIQATALASGENMNCSAHYRITERPADSPLRKWGHDFLKSATSYMDYLEELMQAVGWHGAYKPLIVSFALWLLALFNQQPPALLVDPPYARRYRVAWSCFSGTMREVCTEGKHLWFKFFSFPFSPLGKWALSQVSLTEVERKHETIFFTEHYKLDFKKLPLGAKTSLYYTTYLKKQSWDHYDLVKLYYSQFSINPTHVCKAGKILLEIPEHCYTPRRTE